MLIKRARGSKRFQRHLWTPLYTTNQAAKFEGGEAFPAAAAAPLWQYGLWSFQMGDAKSERFLPKNQHTQRKLLNFENWFNGEVSKIKHHFSK